MKITKTASGKKQIKISRKEWESIGKTAGWIKIANQDPHEIDQSFKNKIMQIIDENFMSASDDSQNPHETNQQMANFLKSLVEYHLLSIKEKYLGRHSTVLADKLLELINTVKDNVGQSTQTISQLFEDIILNEKKKKRFFN